MVLVCDRGAFKYYISTFGGVGSLTRNAYIDHVVRGGLEAKCI